MKTQPMDPDVVLKKLRLHLNVFQHNDDDCTDCTDEEYCDYAGWDIFDTYQLLAHFAAALDEWMSAGGRRPRAWTRSQRWARRLRRLLGKRLP